MPLYTAGKAVLQIIPSLRGVGSAVRVQLGTELRGVGDLGGTQIGTRLGRGVDSGLSRYLPRPRSQLEDVGSTGSASMSALARGTTPVPDQLARVSPVLGRVRDGFASSTVAGMQLSSRMWRRLMAYLRSCARSRPSVFGVIGSPTERAVASATCYLPMSSVRCWVSPSCGSGRPGT
jgi:hypothetical protein